MPRRAQKDHFEMIEMSWRMAAIFGAFFLSLLFPFLVFNILCDYSRCSHVIMRRRGKKVPLQCYLCIHFSCSPLTQPSLLYICITPHLVTFFLFLCSLLLYRNLCFESLCVHWLKGGTCNRLGCSPF